MSSITRPVRRPRRTSDVRWALLLAGPMLVGLTVFYIVPILQTFFYSFTEWGVFGGQTWVGLENYRQLLIDPEFYQALLNTVGYSAITLLAIPLAVVLAALMNQPGLRARGLYRVLFFLPVVTMPVAVGLLWRLILNGEFGYVNQALAVVGIDGPAWLSDPQTALIALGIVGIWCVLGYDIVLILAGMQNIPLGVYEAATMDGASKLRQFFSITLPLLSPTTFFVTVISTIGALQMFDLVFIMIGRDNPALPHVETIVYLFYKVAFTENDKGLASAIVFLLLLVIIALTAVQFRLQRRWVHYD